MPLGQPVSDPALIARLHAQATGAGGDEGDLTDLHGEEFLQKQFPGDAASQAAVRKIANYEMAGTGRNLQRLMPYAAQYDPNFNQQEYPTRLALRRSFTSGQDATNIQAYKTAINHATGLDDAIDRMNNFTVAPHTINSIVQAYKYNTGNEKFQQALQDFNIHKVGVADELAKAFRSAGMSEQDIAAWKQNLQETDSPVALHQAVRSALTMLGGRMETTLDKWNTGMPNEPKTLEGLLGNSAANYHRLLSGGLLGAPTAVSAPGGTMTAPTGQNAPAGTAAAPGGMPGLTEGQTATNRRTGERIILRNGEWVPYGR